MGRVAVTLNVVFIRLPTLVEIRRVSKELSTDSQLLNKTEQAVSSQTFHTGLTQDFIDKTCDNSEDMQWDYFDIKTSITCPDALDSITKHINYYQQHLLYYEALKPKFEEDGLNASHLFEKEKLKTLPEMPPQNRLNKETKKTCKTSQNVSKLTGLPLLEKLKEFIIEQTDIPSVIQVFYNEKDIDKMKAIVKSSDKTLKYKHSCLLKDAVLYGLWLEQLYQLRAGGFKQFIKNNLSFSVTWINKLREMSYIFHEHAKVTSSPQWAVLAY